MNALHVIAPYKYLEMWVFDDPWVGLTQEPFVSGADALIDRLVADIPQAEKGFRLIFSADPFPGFEIKLDWARAEMGGNWYRALTWDREGWLCPALFRYFETAPPELFVQAQAVT